MLRDYTFEERKNKLFISRFGQFISETIKEIVITIVIVAIWLCIMALLIKLDTGGFGSEIVAPILYNTKVEWILPQGSVERQKFLAEYREKYPEDYSKRPEGSTFTLEEAEVYVKDLQEYYRYLKTENDKLLLRIAKLGGNP